MKNTSNLFHKNLFSHFLELKLEENCFADSHRWKKTRRNFPVRRRRRRKTVRFVVRTRSALTLVFWLVRRAKVRRSSYRKSSWNFDRKLFLSAFFRRNARRKEVKQKTRQRRKNVDVRSVRFQLLDLPCRHRTMFGSSTDNVYIRQRLDRYSQIRRCSSCRLRRCFQVGMREELVRTEEENQRYRDLIDLNRRRKVKRRTKIFLATKQFFSRKFDKSTKRRKFSAGDTCPN